MTGVTLARTLAVALAIPLLGWGCGGSTSTDLVGPTDVRCAIALTPAEIPVAAARASGSIAVSAARECAWSATASADWIALASRSGQGNGAIEYTVGENPSPAVREGVIAVGNEQVAVVQEAAPCRFRLLGSGSVGHQGGPLAVGVETFPTCTWSAASEVPWIAVSSGASGQGSGSVGLQVAPNPGAPRQGIVTVADQPFTVSQGADCSFVVSPVVSHVSAAGGVVGVAVDTRPWCTWTATSHAPWIGLPAGGSRSGGGSMALAIAPNDAGPRSATVTIAGQLHTVMQEAAPCAYSIDPSSARVPLSGGSIAVTVITQPWCEWTTVSHVSWIWVTAGSHGVGSGTVIYDVDRRGFPLPRSGTLTIAGQSHTLQQTFILSQDAGAR